MTMNNHYTAVVVGAGIFGLSTTYHLLQKKIGPIALIEQFRIGHRRGSSHGTTRIARGTHLNRLYTDLFDTAMGEDWAHLEEISNQTLCYPTTLCMFGSSSGLISEYAQAMTGTAITPIPLAQARDKFPQLVFTDDMMVMYEETSRIIAAERTLEVLHSACQAAGATVLENTALLSLTTRDSPITIETTNGTITANYLVLATGAWSGRLIPQLHSHLSVVPQTIGYYQRVGQMADYSPTTFPTWIQLEREQELPNIRYGIPPLAGDLMKIVQENLDRTSTHDPTILATTNAVAIQRMDQFAQATLRSSGWQLTKAESCLYTLTPNEDFLVDFHPNNKHIMIITGGSGQGFKFGPLLGRAVANLLLHSKSNIPAFDRIQHLFAL